jgi:hypothetical protein
MISIFIIIKLYVSNDACPVFFLMYLIDLLISLRLPLMHYDISQHLAFNIPSHLVLAASLRTHVPSAPPHSISTGHSVIVD